MTVKEFYENISGNYEEALGRLMNDKLVLRFVQKFPNDPSFGELKKCLEEDDTESAFRQAHTLKGVCANLAFTKLGSSASEITEMLRAGNLAAAKEYFPEVASDYDKVMAGIAGLE